MSAIGGGRGDPPEKRGKLPKSETSILDKIGKNRGIQIHTIDPNTCICNRGTNHVLCTNCGLIVLGRIALGCGLHPQVKHPGEFRQCPRCRAYDMYLQEHTF